MAESRPGSSTRGFRVECQEMKDLLVAECHGKLTFENTPALKEAVGGKMAGRKGIVIDLKEVPMLDSSGLGCIVGLYVSARTRGCQLEVVNASQRIRDLFSLANLLSLFEAAGRYTGKTI